MKPKPGDRVELTVEELDSKGQGVATLEGLTVRLRGALPGDRVRVTLRRIRRRRGEAEGRVTAFLQTGIPRVAPRCVHTEVCGGCVWQDIPYDRQVALKQDMVIRSLRRLGLATELSEPVPAPDPFYYRNKMEFSVGRTDAGDLAIGLHHSGRYDRVFNLDACHLQSEASNAIVDAVRRFAVEKGLTDYDLKQHVGQLRFLTIREGKQTGEAMVVVTTSEEPFPEALELGRMLTERFPQVRSVVRAVNDRKAQVAIGDREERVVGNGTMRERLGRFEFEISPSSFFQTNTLQAERLYERVVSLADPMPGDRVLDLYCGTGAISLFLSDRAERVVGVELAEPSLKDALRNAAQNGVENCAFIAGPAEEVLQQLRRQGESFRVAVTDPPRAGMHPKALSALVLLAPERIVYVSCNPEALAEDLNRLQAAGYRIGPMQLVDMFPHTPHCEVVARLDYEQPTRG